MEAGVSVQKTEETEKIAQIEVKMETLEADWRVGVMKAQKEGTQRKGLKTEVVILTCQGSTNRRGSWSW